MKNLSSNKTSGISLVALIVTIIVLIILTAAVIVTFMEGGIIEKAKEAVFKSDIRTYQEILAVKNAEKQIELATGNGEGGLYNETEYDKIKEIIPEFKEEYKDLIAISNGEIVLGSRTDDPYSTWLADLGIGAGKNAIPENSVVTKLEVGHYVNYDVPAAKQGSYNTKTTNGDETSWIFNDTDESWVYQEGEEEIGYQDIMWRVLKKDENTVTLVSAEPVENISLYGAKGYVYGPDRLDEICRAVYGGRNLKIEDVNELLKNDKTWGDEETNWEYWGPYEEVYDVPAGVRTIAQLEASGEEFVGTLGEREVPEEGKDLGEYAPNYYGYGKSSLTDATVATDIEKDLIFRSNAYWLSSSCVKVAFNDDCAVFDMRYVRSSGVYACLMFDSCGNGGDNVCGLRPVVTLSSNIQVVDESDGGTTAETAWELK
ncbi:MAG: hypothetical protein E7311_03370 [Clostridiales bacterium]|nr:hypothetical protein [Clostridiales bacterium]